MTGFLLIDNIRLNFERHTDFFLEVGSVVVMKFVFGRGGGCRFSDQPTGQRISNHDARGDMGLGYLGGGGW